MIRNKNLKINTNLKKGKIDILNIVNRKLFILCLDTSATANIVKGNLINLIKTLKEILDKEKISIISISKNIEILNINQVEMEEILEETFNNSNIKIIICSNNIDYVQTTDRDRIFDMYHSSKIGGHWCKSNIQQNQRKIFLGKFKSRYSE